MVVIFRITRCCFLFLGFLNLIRQTEKLVGQIDLDLICSSRQLSAGINTIIKEQKRTYNLPNSSFMYRAPSRLGDGGFLQIPIPYGIDSQDVFPPSLQS